MVEHRPLTTFFSHAVLIAGVVAVVFPLFLALVASTHPVEHLIGGIPLWFGDRLAENYAMVLSSTSAGSGGHAVGPMMLNSLIMALGIAIGKIAISLISAYAIVYFRFPLRNVFFWLIFITLMLPVEVRILPTYKAVADVLGPYNWLVQSLGLERLAGYIAGHSVALTLELSFLDSYAGLILPLIASATATFLFRQFFLTIPDELLEASRIDGAGPLRFFWDVVLPLSRTNIAALFVILFIYGWNQYLWPLLVTTDDSMYTVVMGIQRMVHVADTQALWNLIMATAVLAMLPPVLVVVGMQRLFVKGLIETEK